MLENKDFSKLTDDQVIELLSCFCKVDELYKSDHGKITKEKAIEIRRLDHNRDNKAVIQIRTWDNSFMMNIFRDYFKLGSYFHKRLFKPSSKHYLEAFELLESFDNINKN